MKRFDTLSVFTYNLIFAATFFLLSCNNTKYLPKGENLYTGASVKIQSEVPLKTHAVKKELEKVERPKPNSTLLGMRFKLMIYNRAGKDSGKGIRHWLKTKGGEPPVLASTVSAARTAEFMKNRLQVRGYFNAKVSFKTITTKQKTHIEYTAYLPLPYKIQRVIFPSDSSVLSVAIRKTSSNTLLKEGAQYDLDLFKTERLRIDQSLKDSGFFYFNPDFLLFKADSIKGSKLVKITLTVKPETPARAMVPYHLGNIYIIPFSALNDSVKVRIDTVLVDGYYYLDNDSAFRPKVILNSVFLKKGDLYCRHNHNTTLGHLMGMGVFKYVSIRFEDVTGDKNILYAYINLSPMPPYSVQADLEAISKSNNYTGPALTLSAKNRNVFGGAEMLVFNVLGSFETQLSGNQRGLNSYEFGVNSQLYFPKFIAPFKIRNASSFFVPKTKVDVGFRVIQRVQYFNMQSVNTSFGYKWKETAQKEHELTPFSIVFTKLNSTTDAFKLLLLKNPFLRKSFQEQFIIGSMYAYTYNSQIGVQHTNQYYFNGTIDVAGNSLYALQRLFTGRSPSDADPFKILGYTYSQYSRVTADGRYYRRLSEGTKLATRLLVGVGLPYGNSSTMPYTKQFFSGGSNSIRAFQSRTLGPGSYRIPDSLVGKTFLDQSGDIKLEGSAEYRFGIISILKGALFVDGGNVWLASKNAQFPGGEFRMNEFTKQIALGAGFGFRIDLSFFVIRFDLATPLRKPYLPEGQRWVISQIDLGNPTWRGQNLVLNIAVGYPF